MSTHDPRIDAYIAKSAEFARPILEHLRAIVHATCPEVEEGIKWGMPFFSYQGAPMCHMAAFKQHCSFGFWLSKEVIGGNDGDGMGQFGKLASPKDLPPKKELAALLRKAMALNEAGVKHVRPKAGGKPPPVPPEDLAALLAKRQHAAARKTWAGFPPGAQREYIDWIGEAKTDATRQKRLATTLEWLAEASGATGNTKHAEGRPPMIRIARAEDAAAIHAIYAPHVESGVATFENVLPGVDAMRDRILARLPHYPWLVWEEGCEVLAYAYAGRFRERAAYDWIAETSIYVHPDAQRRGIARRLYGTLLEAMRLQGLTQAVGVITMPGATSVAFHESLGFAPAGVWRQCGWKLGQWWDVGVWQKELQATANPPPAVTPFSALAETPVLHALLGQTP